MELFFVGTGAAYNPAWGNNNAFFIYNNHLFLLDCGETTFQRLVTFNVLPIYNKITVIITHLHADHSGSLASLASYCCNVLKKKITIASPNKDVVSLLNIMGVAPIYYDFVQDFACEFEKHLTINPCKVSHANDMECFGYIINDNKETIFYSGDANDIPPEILADFNQNKIDKIYQDTSFENGDSPSHCSLEKLINVIEESKRSKVYCMHLGSDFRKEVLQNGFRLVEAWQ